MSQSTDIGLKLDSDLRHFLTWGLPLNRKSLVVILELLHGVQQRSAATNTYIYILQMSCREMEKNTGIHRRNLPRSISNLQEMNLLRILSTGRARYTEGAGDLGEAAVYDLQPLFVRLAEWLDAGSPKAEKKAQLEPLKAFA